MNISNLPLGPILNLTDFHNNALIEIRKPKVEIDRTEKSNEEVSYSLRVEVTTNRCVPEHTLNESECWRLVEICKKFGAIGVVCALTMSLEVSGRNLPFILQELGRLLSQLTGECEVCKYRAMVSSKEEEIRNDISMRLLFTGEISNCSIEGAVTHNKDEYETFITLLPDDDPGFEKALELAHEMDRAVGNKTVEEQDEEQRRTPNTTGNPRFLKLGFRDTLDLSRGYNIKARLNSPYLKELINNPTSKIFTFGLDSELWKEREDREVSYVIGIAKKGDTVNRINLNG